MKLRISSAIALLTLASAASAQTLGRVSVGAQVTRNGTTDADVESTTAFSPIVRLNPRKGWGPTAGLNWFKADLLQPDLGTAFAQLRVRPLMGGVSYTLGSPTVLVGVSIVTGPSFNRARFLERYDRSPVESISAHNSWAVRPAVGLTIALAPRVAIAATGGYIVNRPRIEYRDQAGTVVTGRWKADTFVVSVGMVYSVF